MMTETKAPAWTALFPLLALMWIAHFFVDVMLSIWPVYKTMVDFDLAQAGVIVAIGALFGEGSQLIFGSLSDKGYRQLIIAVGLLLTTASAFLAYSISPLALFFLYLTTCVGSGCFHPAASGLMNTLLPARRSLLMGIFASGGSLGLAAGQLIFTQIYSAGEEHVYLLALPALILIGFLAFYRMPTAAVPQASASKAAYFADFAKFLKNPSLRSLYLLQVANQSIFWGTIFILPDALKTLGFAEWICYGGGHLCLILGGASMMIPGGYLADKYSARQVLLYAGLISCMAFYFFLFFGSYSILLALVSLFVVGASLALVNPVGVSLGTRYEPQKAGAVSAFLMGLVWCVSEAVGPGGVGLLSTWFSDYAPVKALAVLGCFFLVQIYTTLCLPKTEPELELSPELAG